jgi:hypothetical protein
VIYGLSNIQESEKKDRCDKEEVKIPSLYTMHGNRNCGVNVEN